MMLRTPLAVAFLPLFACAGMKVIPIQKDKIQSVHRIAMVGFSLSNAIAGDANEDKSSSGFSGLINKVSTVKQQVSGDDQKRSADEADGAVGAMMTQMTQRFGWEVFPLDRLDASPTYSRRLHDKPTAGMLDGSVRNDRLISYKSATDWLDDGAAAALATELGVDALVAVRVEMVPGQKDTGITLSAGSNTTGSYTLRPKARLTFRMYDATGNVIWNRVVEGTPSAKGISTILGVENRSTETEAFVEATVHAWAALVANYDGPSA